MKAIEPSLLAIDKNNSLNQLARIKELGIKYVHYDVMDRKFVPAAAYKTQFLQDLAKIGLKPNIHLMVNDPLEWIDLYLNKNTNSIVFHAETQSIDKSIEILSKIKDNGILAGISIKPNTDLSQYKKIMPYCDIILIMSVEPGYGGQKFLPKSLSNLKIANENKKQKPNLIIQIDGGINFDIIKELIDKVDWFVAGTWFFSNIDNMSEWLDKFHNLSYKTEQN